MWGEGWIIYVKLYRLLKILPSVLSVKSDTTLQYSSKCMYVVTKLFVGINNNEQNKIH